MIRLKSPKPKKRTLIDIKLVTVLFWKIKHIEVVPFGNWHPGFGCPVGFSGCPGLLEHWVLSFQHSPHLAQICF